MNIRIVGRIESRLSAEDDHPYRTGAFRPNFVEYDADDLEVVEGRLPEGLEGVYLRNTENPVMPSLGRYHPFDGDGMLHAIHFHAGKASYRNRFVRTAGLAAELAAGEPLYAGIIESPALSKREGWGARGRMKDASSTDVVVHAGRALSTFYQCGDAYEHDPITLESHGPARWGGRFPPWGISAHPKLDEHTGELLWFSYSKHPPYLHYGVLDSEGRLVHQTPVPLPGARLPHDMAFTERFAILNDLPLFWDPMRLGQGAHRPRLFKDLPSRFAILPRRGGVADVRWFEAEPTYVLHFINAYEHGDEVVLDGFFQTDPLPRPDPADGAYGPLMKMVDTGAMGCRPWRWRFDMKTGRTREEQLCDACCEFPTLHGRFAGRPYRYTVTTTAKPGWFLFDGLLRLDVQTGATQRFPFPEGVYGSEAPIAPRRGGSSEDDAFVVTFVSDIPNDRSECWVFDAKNLAGGPIARVSLPERIASGTHACWAPATQLTDRMSA